jgi:hypothetical protein
MKYIFILLIVTTRLWAQDLTTIAEKSQWVETGRADEMHRLCLDFAKKYPTWVECRSYGKSPEGRELKALIVFSKQKKTPKINLWAQAGIHAGEIDGKDAGFWLLKDYLADEKKRIVFESVRFIFIPIVNIDGHERFSTNNRPNQIGPKEMGFRVTAQNYNLNRDFLKAQASEMQDLLKLWHEFSPQISLDLHVTNGAQFEAEIGFVVTPTAHSEKTDLHLLGSKMEERLVAQMEGRGHKALPFYPELINEKNPKEGFERYVPGVKYAHGYWREQGKIGVLVEAHSWKPYVKRVQLHRDTLAIFLEFTEQWGDEITRLTDNFDSSLSEVLPLKYQASKKATWLNFPAFKFKTVKSPITGQQVVVYSNEREVWRLPLYEELKLQSYQAKDFKSYYIPVSERLWLEEKLQLHRLEYQELSEDLVADFQVFRADEMKFSDKSREGNQTLEVQGSWRKERAKLLKGSLIVPIKQKKSHLLAYMFEPTSYDSFLYWGYFNRFFENKEYMEDYVLEVVAQQMLKDKKIKKEFEQKMRDKNFRHDSLKRFEFFYQKHPAYDQSFKRYPILRL